MKLRIQPTTTVNGLAHALTTHFPTPPGTQLDSSQLSIWHGPALMDANQPLLIGYGNSIQFPATLQTANTTWTTARDTLSPTDDSLSFEEFFSQSHLQAPIGFFSFGFNQETPGIIQIQQRTFVQTSAGAWLLEIEGDTPLTFVPIPGVDPVFNLIDDTQASWLTSVTGLVQDLQAGVATKTVLARDVIIQSSTPIDLSLVLRKLADAYPTCWQFAVAGLAGATPEMLADVRLGLVRSRVLAGTCTPGNEADLVDSIKDLTEHRFAADSVKDALAPLCTQLSANQKPFILQLPNVSHLATDVQGELAETTVSEGAPLISVLQKLHPTAAVCGTPREVAFELIAKHETTLRGRYAGPVGWMDAAGNGAAGLALRCGQLQADKQSMQLLAGCGIMPDSNPEAELAETRAKLRPMLSVFGLVS